MFKVGDKVRVVCDNGYRGVSIGQVAVVTWAAGGSISLMRGSCEEHNSLDSENWHFCFPNHCCAAVTEPTPPRKMHPDDFVLAVCEFATDNGFGVTQLYFDGTEFVGAALPHHSYSV